MIGVSSARQCGRGWFLGVHRSARESIEIPRTCNNSLIFINLLYAPGIFLLSEKCESRHVDGPLGQLVGEGNGHS